MEPKRFTSPIKYLEWISETINVVCPNCSEKAIIKENRTTQDGVYYCRNNKGYNYECKACYQVINYIKIYQYKLKLYCPSCADVIQYNSDWTDKKNEIINVSCKSCSESIQAKPNVTSSNAFWYKNNRIAFKYWYQLNYKGNLLWAVNEKHIQFLEDYISADLRERYPKSYGMMLAERLPKFIKNKKNRESLLKALKKLKLK